MIDASHLGPGTLLAGKFRIQRLLGTGAMGAVYAVDHELTHHKRALKVLHPSLRNVPDLVRRFLNEASAAARTGNAHLVETFDAGTLPTGEPYLVMELLVGEPLDSILKREGRLHFALATEIVAQAAEGIHAAHHAGIIHRDLKPENLFVTTRDRAPFVKILDFGVSKFAAVSADPMGQTRAGMVYGSPAYMSPEQLAAAPDVDARTDVFALGVVLYQSLTGVLPFDGPTIDAISRRVLSGDPPPLQTLRQDLPPALVAVVYRALAPLREHRIPTASALAEALAPFRGAVPWPEAVEFGHAPTIISDPPMISTSPMVGAPSLPHSLPPSLPPGVPRARHFIPIAVGAAMVVVAVATSLVLARSRARAVAAPLGPLPAPRSAIVTGPAAPEPSVAVTVVPTCLPAVPTCEPAVPPSVLGRRATDARKAPAPPSATASVNSSRPSAARSLGLSEDNPFR
jgi:eukaryotic-like serine/threonine-protein kinase